MRTHIAQLTAVAALLLGSATAVAQTYFYNVQNLGAVPGQWALAGVTAQDMSADGTRVAGTSVWNGYVWEEGIGMRALAKPAGTSVISVQAVTNDGAAVGYSGLTAASQRAQYWDPSGGLQSLHQTGWVSSRAIGFNESGQVLVNASVPNGASTVNRGFLGTISGGFVPLTAAAPWGTGIDLNDAGHVLFGDINGYFLRHPLGNTSSLGTAFTPHALNERGQVGGIANGTAARWTLGSGWQTLPAPPTLNLRQLGGVNSFAQVVASHAVQTQISPPQFDYFAHVYTDGIGWLELNSLVDPALFVDVETTVGITDDGKIAAYGSYGPDNRALLLEPRFVSVYGSGCPGGSGVPKALVAGIPQGGDRIALLGSGGPPGAVGVMLVSLGSANIPTLGCSLLIDPIGAVSLLVTAGPMGQCNLPIDLQLVTSGHTIYVQYVSVDPAAANGALAFSNGVQVDIQ